MVNKITIVFISTEVEIKPDNKGMYVLSLVAGDRPGLLARFALILDAHDVRPRSTRSAAVQKTYLGQREAVIRSRRDEIFSR